MNRIAQLEQESRDLLDHLNAITDAHQLELKGVRDNLTCHIDQGTQESAKLLAQTSKIRDAQQEELRVTRDDLTNRITQLEQESRDLLDHFNAITDAHQLELRAMWDNLSRRIDQGSQESTKLLAQTSKIRDAQQEELRATRDDLTNRITQLEQENSDLFAKLFKIDSVYQKELNSVRTEIERLQKEHEETSRKSIISENGAQSSVNTPFESNQSVRVVRELLSAYQRVGAVAALWLKGFHVNGNITDVDEHLVTLTTGVTSIVKVENNTNDVVIDTPNRIRVKLDDIQAVSDGD
ncbi:hypothetical protein J31TS6_11380 [Brevibacillus reuszeri]|uniref:hypothetical protein n=1 Tax=Brevibacillus reuszeri TaxID=54915 RepID=UPI001B1F3D56|nr:hypothetical protein [Brevibacillus reuszeri]GIO05110.1 hypothetical protein J31TS6_11380 [Brevibacillus reuszeri]